MSINKTGFISKHPVQTGACSIPRWSRMCCGEGDYIWEA